MDEEELQDLLLDWLGDEDSAPNLGTDFEGNELSIEAVHTFQMAGVLTHNKGLTIRLSDGSEFQLQIVQSRLNREDG